MLGLLEANFCCFTVKRNAASPVVMISASDQGIKVTFEVV